MYVCMYVCMCGRETKTDLSLPFIALMTKGGRKQTNGGIEKAYSGRRVRHGRTHPVVGVQGRWGFVVCPQSGTTGGTYCTCCFEELLVVGSIKDNGTNDGCDRNRTVVCALW